MRQTATIQKALFKGEMRDHDSVIDFLMSQSNVMPRLNDRVLSSTTRYLDMTGGANIDKDILVLDSLSTRDVVSRFIDSLSYVTSTSGPNASSKNKLTPITVWMVADVTEAAGRQLVRNALDYSGSSRLMRLSLVHNSKSPLKDLQVEYAEMVDAALISGDIRLLNTLLKDVNAQALMDGSKSANDFGVAVLDSALQLELHNMLVSRALEFLPGQRGLVVNGRVIGNPLNAFI